MTDASDGGPASEKTDGGAPPATKEGESAAADEEPTARSNEGSPAHANEGAAPGSGERRSETASDDAADADDDAYGGILTAYPYAFLASDSLLFKTYAVIGGLVTLLVVTLFTFAVVNLLGSSADAPGGTFTFSRAFFFFLMLLVIVPLVTPVLLVARRHRRRGGNRRYDRALAAAGYLFVLAFYVGLGISVPPALQEDSPGALGAVLYSLPRFSGVVPPIVGAAVIYLVHRRYR